MKVLLIRHGKVDMEWEKTYTSEEYDKTKAVSADMVELEDDDLEDVAGGMEPCGPLVRFIKIIQKNKEH